jgi:transposase
VHPLWIPKLPVGAASASGSKDAIASRDIPETRNIGFQCWRNVTKRAISCLPSEGESARFAFSRGWALLAYSQFCENYRRYAKSLKRSMRQIHRAGEKLFIDYAGPTLELIGGSRAHIFVAALGASSYTYACATPRETMADWLGATALALRYIGGVPQLIVPDNPRALIANADRYEPRANETVLDFARHYATSFLPARPYHPQDKELTS